MNPVHLVAFVGLIVLAVSMYIYNKKLDMDKDFKPTVRRLSMEDIQKLRGDTYEI